MTRQKEDLKRIPGEAAGRCAAVRAGGLAYVVATDPVCAEGIEAQTAGALKELDRLLAEVGNDRTRLLQATVYLSDIGFKPRMDAVWNDWIGPEENWPQRACVGVDLDPGYLIEVVVTAAVLE